jgi:DinB family protein
MNPYVERIVGLVGDRPVLESLEHTAKRIEAMATTLDGRRMERSYAPGKWTAREILAHLADAEVGMGFRLRQVLAEENHHAQPFDQDRWAARYPGLDGAAAGRAFVGLRAWNLALIRSLSAQDLERPYVHGERGPESVGLIVRLLAGHDLNHLAQLETIAAS